MTKNAYIDEYNRVIKNIDYLKEQVDVINNSLIEPYEKIKEIEEKYGVKGLEQSRKELMISIKDDVNYKTYFYFRAIIDGIYNLLKEYGWEYSSELFCFLRDKYNIRCCFEYGFEEYWVDTISAFSVTQTFGLEYFDDMTSFIVCREYDSCDEIKLPENLSIDQVLTDSQALLKELVKLDKQKERDEEFELYLHLKKKYEPVESGDGIN